MLDRTWKRVGQGREREVGNERRGIRRGETGKYPLIQTACDRVSCLIMHVFLSVALYDNVHMYHSNSQLTS